MPRCGWYSHLNDDMTIRLGGHSFFKSLEFNGAKFEIIRWYEYKELRIITFYLILMIRKFSGFSNAKRKNYRTSYSLCFETFKIVK